MRLEDIERVAVLGAGTMGHGIAEVIAMAGYDVAMRDINRELVQRGYENLEWSVNKLAEKGQIDEAPEAVLNRVRPVVELEDAVSDADLVVEAVPEKMDIKKEVYQDVEQYAPDRTIFATNTSSLSITELSEVTNRPGQFCGMHYFNPPVRMPLVEVIRGEHSTDETLDLVEAFAADIDKTPVRVRKDIPGFIVNRVLVPLMNEAAWMVETGETSVAEVDSKAKYDLGLPMGIFELLDQVGIDVPYHVLEYMESVEGAAYQPCPLLVEKVEQGDLGRKSGKGFYDYDEEGVDIPTDVDADEVADRLVAVMANEVAKLLDRDVASVTEIDRAVKLGGGFSQGPAAMADDIGLPRLTSVLEADDEGSSRYGLSDALKERANSVGRFYTEDAGDDTELETLRVERPTERVGQIIIDRSHALNTVNEGVLDDLPRAIEQLESDDDVRAVVVSGADGTFCAGADVQRLLSSDSYSALDLSRKGRRAFGRLEECPMPVVAAIDGYALGGGMELSMYADIRVASSNAELGQPEHNLGVLPGWGGTQRLSRLIGESRAKEIIFTADRYDAETMYEYGFVNEVVDDSAEERALELAATLAEGPPVAQEFTKSAMHDGRDDLDTGLELESLAFGHLWNGDDVTEGISAFMDSRDADFTGR